MKPLIIFNRIIPIIYFLMVIFIMSSCTLTTSVGVKPKYKIVVVEDDDNDDDDDDDCKKRKKKYHDHDDDEDDDD